MVDFKTRQYYYNQCKPNEPLDPTDTRNVDFDAEGTEGAQLRGVSWVERLASQVELSDEPTCLLFTGLPGSGKSTELRRLSKRLADPHRAHLLPVIVEAEEVVDLASAVDIPDLIAAIIYAADKAVLDAEGRESAQALRDGYLKRFWQWLTTTEVKLTEAEFGVPDVAQLVLEMKTRPSLRERIRQTVAANFTYFLQEAKAEIQAINKRACARGYSGLVVIFDSLEKLRGISTNWHNVLASAEQVFGSGAPYMQLPVHVIYTVPAALVTRQFERIHFMPMVKLRERDGTPFSPGVAAMRTLIRKRIPDQHLPAFLGSEAEERILQLIRASGGYPRETVRLLQTVVSADQLPISTAGFERVQNEVRDGYRSVVTASAFDWLARVATDHYLTIAEEGHRQAADSMLSNNAILRYVNDRDWFDLHPALYDIPGIQEAIRKLQQGTTPKETGEDRGA